MDDPACVISDWQSSIAAPDLADWLTVAAYLIAALLSARAAEVAALRCLARDRNFWRIATVLLVLLGINELLDLQTLLTSIGRAHARANGWYEGRRIVQYAFVTALAAMTLVAGIAGLLLIKRAHPAVRLALAGLVFIGLFVLIRAASFNHIDELLGRGPAEFTWGSMQELVGILVIASGAALYSRQQPSKPS